MRVTVRYFGYLAEYAGRREKTLEVREGSRVKEVVTLPPGVTLEDLVLLRNGRPASPDDELSDGDTVSVLPHISGG